ncbi:MAG: Lrp/AsnC family transcriptional regulator [Thermoplasmata archaeon]
MSCGLVGSDYMPAVEMDDLDMKIIRILNSDARKSYRDIARELDVSLSTVSKRIKRLESERVIEGYAPILNAEKLGFDIHAIIGVKILHGKILETEKALAKDPAVYAVFDSTGDWDAIIQARFRTRAELNAFVKKVLEHEDVEKTYTQIVLNVTKDEKRILV